MGFARQVKFIVFAIICGLIYSKYREFTIPRQLQKFNLHEYWGPGSGENYLEKNETVLSEVRYKEAPIKKLIEKLNETIYLLSPLEDTAFEYGVNSNFIKEFVNYWRDDYLVRWLSREVFFNRMPHFITEIQGIKLHYVHTRATYEVYNKTIIPLVMIHGWPGSVREFYDVITWLALPDRDELDVVFEIVAPSLPGYLWSEAPHKPGFGVAEMAILIRNLMLRLGYERFYVQGGDWGSILGSTIATIFPENVIGFHSNFCGASGPMSTIKSFIASFYPTAFVDEKYVDFHFPISTKFSELLLETGYMHIQATKPDTIGLALTNNPIGLAAYIFEKFSTWTNPANRKRKDGGWSKFTQDFKDAILDDITAYYLTNSITSSVRLYSEALSLKQLSYQLDSIPTMVPVGCTRFKHDIMHAFDWQLKDKYPNLIHSTYHLKGGHFAALEQPELFFQDFAAFVNKVEKLRRNNNKDEIDDN